MDIILLAFSCVLCGVLLILIGAFLGKVFHTTQKIQKLGLDRPLKLGYSQQFLNYVSYPGIFLPITIVFFGATIVIASFLIAISGAISWLLY